MACTVFNPVMRSVTVEGNRVKAIQTGGPSGGCIPADMFDTPVDYETLAQLGSIMGSGGMVVIDDTSSMVDFAKFFMEFSKDESCGKCVPCRVGTEKAVALLDGAGVTIASVSVGRIMSASRNSRCE